MTSWNPFRRTRTDTPRRASKSPFPRPKYRLELERFESRWYPGDTILGSLLGANLIALAPGRLAALPADELPSGPSLLLGGLERPETWAADLARLTFVTLPRGEEAPPGSAGFRAQVAVGGGEGELPRTTVTAALWSWEGASELFGNPLVSEWPTAGAASSARLPVRSADPMTADDSSLRSGDGGGVLPGRPGVEWGAEQGPTQPWLRSRDVPDEWDYGRIPPRVTPEEMERLRKPPASNPPSGGASPGGGGSSTASSTRRPFLNQNFGRQPLAFEPNRGQANSRAQFLTRGKGYSIFLTPTEAALVLQQPLANPRQRAVVRMQIIGGNPAAQGVGLEQLPGRSNYFRGNDPRQWRTGIPHYRKIAYRDVYPGIDLIHYGNQRQLEFDFVVNPGASPSAIQLAFPGIGNPRLDTQGRLILPTPAGDVIQHAPVIYQLLNGVRQPITGGYVLQSLNRLAFQIGAYDRTRPLYIDPVLHYEVSLGANGYDESWGIAADASGNAYVSGTTNSTDFPVTDQTTYAGDVDVFVAKLNTEGTSILYATYFGGVDRDEARGIAVDSTGSAYVTGDTRSLNLPTTAGVIQPSHSGDPDIDDTFVAKFDTLNGGLVYSTYLGGTRYEHAGGIAVDSSGNAHVTGQTYSSDFPISNAFQPVHECLFGCSGNATPDAYVAKLNYDASALWYSTYLGGATYDKGLAITLDESGSAYIVGSTWSDDFPTANALQTVLRGETDVFVTKIDSSGALTYSTYLGGTGSDGTDTDFYGYAGIAVDRLGNTYVTGLTQSSDFPTASAFQPASGSPYPLADAFVTKLNPSGNALVYSTYLGGEGYDLGEAIAVDEFGSAYVGGGTFSSDFWSVNPLPGYSTFERSAFITKLSPGGESLVYSTPYYTSPSSPAGTFVSGIAIDPNRDLYVTGWSGSPHSHYAESDPFVIKISERPIVDIWAIANAPEEGPGSGLFAVTRTDDLGGLRVYYTVDRFSTATPDLDYTTLTGFVDIPNGSTAGVISVDAVNDGVPEPDETVTVTLRTDPSNYKLGSSRSATVWITDPVGKALYTLDANNALVVTPGVVHHDFAGWSVDLRAQAIGIATTSFTWDVSPQQAPDAVNVSGQNTSRLTFQWSSQVPAVRDNVITLTVSHSGGRDFVQKLRFRVVPSASPSWIADGSRPTTFPYWPIVLAPDTLTGRQDTVDGPTYRVGMTTGEVQTSHTLPAHHPGVAPLQLLYNSTAADRLPVFIDHYELTGSPPPKLGARLTLNGVVGPMTYFHSSNLIAGDILHIPLQAQAGQVPTTSNRYPYRVERIHYNDGGTPLATYSYDGQVSIVKPDLFPWGSGWSLANLQRLRILADGIILELPGGASLWFRLDSGNYITPAGDFSTLTIGVGVYVRTLKDGTQIKFDSTTGLQTEIVDPNGRRTAFLYTGTQLTAVRDFTNRDTTFDYGTPNTVRITDPAGRTTTVAYDGNGTTSITDPDPDDSGPLLSPVSGFQYGALGRLTRITDPRSNPTDFAYNFAGRVGTITRADTTTALVTALQVRGLYPEGSTSIANPATMTLAAGARSEYRDPRGNTWYSRFDWLGFGQATQEQDPYLNMAVQYRDRNGLAWIDSDPRGNRTHAQFDSKGNPTTITYADETTDRFSYNLTYSKPLWHIDPNGNLATYQYDARGNLERIIDPYLNETLYTYTYDGFLLAERDARQSYTTYGYDTLRRRDQMTLPDDDTDPANNPKYFYEYDDFGNRLKVTDPLTRVTSYGHDRLNRLTRTDEAWNATGAPPMRSATMQYDPNGNLQSATTGISGDSTYQHRATASYAYDSLDRRTLAIEDFGGLNKTTATAYDPAGNVRSVTNPRNVVTSYSYDKANRRVETFEAYGVANLQRITTVVHDVAGNVLETVDPLGRLTRYTYDARNRRTSVTEAVDTTEQRTLQTVYDPAGNVIRAINGLNQTTSYAYDKLHRRTHVEEGVGTQQRRLATTAYDAVGNVLSTTTGQAPQDPDYQKVHTVSYAYDAQNRRTRAIEGFNDASLRRTTTIQFDAVGNVTAEIRPRIYDNETPAPDPRNVHTSYVYDALHRRTQVIEAANVDALKRTATTVYDAADNVRETQRPRVPDITSEGQAPTPRFLTATFAYDKLNRRTEMTEGIGSADKRTLATQYDLNDNVTATVNGRGVPSSYVFDALDRQTQSIEAPHDSLLRRTSTTVYDAADNIIRVVNPRGVATAFRYDALDRRTVSLDARGPTLTSYDAADNVLFMVNPRDFITSYAYDGLNRRTRSIEAFEEPGYERSTTTLYDAADNIRSTTDALGRPTTYTHDLYNRRTSVRNPLQQVTVTDYTAQDNPRHVIDARQVGTSFQYDALGRRTQVIEAASYPSPPTMPALGHPSPVTVFNYDAFDNVVSVTDPLMHTSSYAYDVFQRRVAVTDPLLHTVATLYDAADNVVSVRDATNHLVTHAYDALNRRTQTTDGAEFTDPVDVPKRRVSNMTYDAADNPRTVKDALNNVTTFTHDAMNRRVVTIDAKGKATRTSYDGNNNITRIIDSEGNQTRYVFDPLDQRVVMTDPTGRSAGFLYYPTGNLQASVDRRGFSRLFTYDELNRPYVEKWYLPGISTPAHTITHTYDAAGNVLTAANNAGTYTMAYDALNRVVRREQLFNVVMTHTYDAASRRQRVQDSFGYFVDSVYDEANRLVARSTLAGTAPMLVGLQYDVRNQLTTVTYDLSINSILVRAATGKFQPNPFGQPELYEWRRGNSTAPRVHALTYTYDKAGRLTHEERQTFGIVQGPPPGDPSDYTYTGTDREVVNYDTTHQLEEVRKDSGTSLVSYSYSDNGNRTLQNNEEVTRGTGNRIIDDPMWTYTYDDEGNLRSRTAKDVTFPPHLGVSNRDLWIYDYDHANRLIGVSKYDKDNPGTVLEYTAYAYDVFGHRIERVHPAGTQRFVYDGADVWADLNGTNQVAVRYLRGDAVDQLFGRIEGPATSTPLPADTVSWYATDRQQSVLGILSGNGQEAYKWARYRGFVPIVVCRCGILSAKDRYEYTGREFEFTTGLQYNRGRWYEPLSGRWISEDPLGFAAGDSNLYRYVHNSPTNAIDPKGYFLSWVGAGLGALVGSATYLVGSLITGNQITLGGLAGAAGSGALVGAAFGALTGDVSALAVIGYGIAAGAIGGGVNSVVQQGIDKGWGKIDLAEVGLGMLGGAVGGAISGGILGRNPLTAGIGRWLASGFAGGSGGGAAAGAVSALAQGQDPWEGAWQGAKQGAVYGTVGGYFGFGAVRGYQHVQTHGWKASTRAFGGALKRLWSDESGTLDPGPLFGQERKITPPEWATLEPNTTRTAKESVGNLERSMRNNGIPQPDPDHVGHHVIPGSIYEKIPMLKEIGFRIDHFPNGHWVHQDFHPGRHPAYTSAMKKILSEIPMPADLVSRAVAAQQVGKVMDAAKSVLSGQKPLLRFKDAQGLNPKLTHAEFMAQWEAAIRAAMK